MRSENRQDSFVAIVPVRAGSKGLLGKNLRLLNGVPLYLHAVRQGLRTVGRVLLSTDISEVTQQELPEGCTLCPRPPELAADGTPMAPVIAHLIELECLHNSTLILLQATSPLRHDSDIASAVSLYRGGRHDMVMSVVERDRAVLKYGTLSDSDFEAIRAPGYCFQNRQCLPPVYGPNGAVYVFSASQFLVAGGFPFGKIGAVVMPASRSIDIDTADDFQKVEEMMRQHGQVAYTGKQGH